MTDERALAGTVTDVVVTHSPTAGTLALAQMSDAEFEARLLALKRGQERVQRVQRELMHPDVDYGVIPGTGGKPTLLKPGAEKLCNLYGLIPEFKWERFPGDGESTPTLQFLVTCYLHAGADGPVVGMGVGEANSWERKHRYRTAERACPACGALKTIRKSKEPGSGWYCWAKIGGCGRTFKQDDPELTSQQLGQVDNPDPYDLANTLIKIGAKRAYVDASLRTTATSGLFTQDLEDMAGPADAPNGQPAAPKPPTQAPAGKPSQKASPATAPATPPPAEDVEPIEAPATDDWTVFWKTALGYGYPNNAAVLRALGVKDLAEWMASGKTIAGALDELAALKGVKKP